MSGFFGLGFPNLGHATLRQIKSCFFFNEISQKVWHLANNINQGYEIASYRYLSFEMGL